MKLNKLFLVSILLLAILALGAASASEDISSTDEVLGDSIDDSLEETNAPDETLNENELSLSDLKNELESDKREINLTNDYKYSSGDDDYTTISIKTPSLIDGKGHVIDGNGKGLNLTINSNGLTIKNLIFKNFNRESNNFILWNATGGRLENCSFEDMVCGEESMFELNAANFTLDNCSFNRINLWGLINSGADDICLSNSSFSNINTTNLIYLTGDNFQLNNCSIDGNNVTLYLLRIIGNNSQIINSNFSGNGRDYGGNLIYQQGNICIIHNCSFENNFMLYEKEDSIISFGSLRTQMENRTVANISVTNTSFINNVGLPIESYATSGNITGCIFENNSGVIDTNHYDIYRDNGKYDFEIIPRNNTLIGDFSPDYEEVNNLLTIWYFGVKEGNITVLLNGTESYNRKLESDELYISPNYLNPVKAGEFPITVKFIGDEEFILYEGNIIIDYDFELTKQGAVIFPGFELSPHGVLNLEIILPKAATGTLIFNDGISNHTLEYADGKAFYPLNGTTYDELGEYEMSISLIGDPNFPQKTKTYKLTFAPKVDMPSFVSVGEIDYIFYDFPDGFDGNLLIYNRSDDGGEILDLFLNYTLNESGMLPLPAFEKGKYFYWVDYGIDNFYPGIRCIENEDGYDSSIGSNTIKIGEDAVITVRSPADEIEPQLWVFIDTNDILEINPRFVLNSSELTFNISNLDIGVHKIKVLIVDSYNWYYSNNFLLTVIPKTSEDLQKIIDDAKPGDVVDLGNETYYNVSNVNISKDITITGGTILGSEDASYIFNVAPISQGGPSELNITDVNFKLNNVNTIVKALGENATGASAIDVAAINIKANNIELANDNVVPESLVVLELESERPILSTTNNISITGNTIAAGMCPFIFKVSSIDSSSDINISKQNLTVERKATQIIYENMNTTAVSPLDPNTGEWFCWRLVDGDGKPIANAPMKIGFNGVIYDEDNGMVTDKNGYAKLQINLGYKGDYTFAVSFLGNDEYNASFVVAKIKVATQTGSLTVPNRSYAASAKTKALTATLKTKRGKVIANKKISFTVNGKTYTAKTNAKGVATVNVSLNKKGTYNFVVKFAGDSTYAAITKKATLVIK